MRRHSRAHTLAARRRNILRWRRYARTFVYEPGRPDIDDGFWSQEGRFNKLTLSCDGHAICRLDRALHKFRTGKRAVYRRLDRRDADAY